jgi:glutamyl-tRNA synthetase
VTGLTEATRLIEELGPAGFEPATLEPPMRALCDERDWKVGDLFMAVRVAITGRRATPPLFDVMAAIGYEPTLERLRAAAALAATIGSEE